MKNLKNLKIFCVDDELFTLHLSQGVLNKMDYNDVSIFNSGESCLEKISENPDVVFLDYNMEGMNGLEVLKEIKKYNPSIYVVMLSAQDNDEITKATLEYGAFTYLRKEGNLHDMLEGIMEKVGPRIAAVQSFLNLTSKSNKPQTFNRNEE